MKCCEYFPDALYTLGVDRVNPAEKCFSSTVNLSTVATGLSSWHLALLFFHYWMIDTHTYTVTQRCSPKHHTAMQHEFPWIWLCAEAHCQGLIGSIRCCHKVFFCIIWICPSRNFCHSQTHLLERMCTFDRIRCEQKQSWMVKAHRLLIIGFPKQDTDLNGYYILWSAKMIF